MPSWGTACAPAILAESTRTAEVKVRGHPLVEGPPALLRTSARGSTLAGKRRPGSAPRIGPTGPSRIHAATPRVTRKQKPSSLVARRGLLDTHPPPPHDVHFGERGRWTPAAGDPLAPHTGSRARVPERPRSGEPRSQRGSQRPHTDPNGENHLRPRPLTPQDPERTDWGNQVPTCGGPLALHAITLPGPQRQTPEGQVPAWGTTCTPAILPESTRAAEAKVSGHPLPGGPPTLLRTPARGSQMTEKHRPGSHPSFGPTGPPRIRATTPSISSEARATFLRG